MVTDKINLPHMIEGWTLSGSAKHINSKNIFKYMNGAGELYLGYHFDNLTVYEYIKNDNMIAVELYQMQSSDDSFGLLSLDWGGENINLNADRIANNSEPIAPVSRALYGKGLLRIWSGSLYVRIIAVKDMPEIKGIILKIAKIIIHNRLNPPQPELLNVLSAVINRTWKLKRNRIGYFFSYLVLNSWYYLSHDNILNLNHSTEAVFAPYQEIKDNKRKNRFYLLVIKYPNKQDANTALKNFLKIYLSKSPRPLKDKIKLAEKGCFEIEDGWVGYRQYQRFLLIVFECPDMKTATAVIEQKSFNKFLKEK